MPAPSHRPPSGSGGPGLWDPMPLVPPVAPPTPAPPEEFVWSKPERLKDRPADLPAAPARPKRRAAAPRKAPTKQAAKKKAAKPKRAGGRPVKKAAKKKGARK